MISGFQVDQARFVTQLRKLRLTLGLESGPFIRQQFRLLMQHIMRLTPPRSYSQGRKRVATDISRVLTPFDAARIKNRRLREIVATGDTEAFNAFADAAGMKAHAMPSSQLPAEHARYRDRRGRMRRRRPSYAIGRRDERELKRYIRHKQANVGIARAGWAPALMAAGGAVPSWVSRHGSLYGIVQDRSALDTRPEMIARNRTPWANRRDEGSRIIRNAMLARRNAMIRQEKIMVEKAAARSGLTA